MLGSNSSVDSGAEIPGRVPLAPSQMESLPNGVKSRRFGGSASIAQKILSLVGSGRSSSIWWPWCPSSSRCLSRQTVSRVLRDHVRAIANRHPPIQVLMYGHQLAG